MWGGKACMVIPLALFALCIVLCAKLLLFGGRRQPGQYNWDTSSYCQRWQVGCCKYEQDQMKWWLGQLLRGWYSWGGIAQQFDVIIMMYSWAAHHFAARSDRWVAQTASTRP